MPRINADKLNLEERVIKTNKVQKTHKGGRTMSWNALVVVGDGEGRAGIGLGKARGVPDAIRKGVEDAKKQIIEIPLVGNTIPHEALGRAGASLVLLKPASPGTGVVAGGSVRAILEVAGVKDVLGKSLGAPNAINTARATMDCLGKLQDARDVARLRGKTIEDLLPKGVLRAMNASTLQAEPEAEAEAIEEVKAETKAEAEPEVKVETETKAKVEPEVKVETEAKVEAEPEVKVETETKVEAEPEVKVEAATEEVVSIAEGEGNA